MPLRHKSAQKRARQIKKRTERNKKNKSLIKGLVKKALTETEKEAAVNEFKKAMSALDRAAVKRVIHPNKAARLKSKLAKAVNKK
ncbi:MAG: 30S ribosomal protein S20 [Ignavibacteria bacterium]